VAQALGGCLRVMLPPLLLQLPFRHHQLPVCFSCYSTITTTTYVSTATTYLCLSFFMSCVSSTNSS
jgi:hypothetical protein